VDVRQIKEVIYFLDKYAETESVLGAKKMFDLAQVNYRKYNKSDKEYCLKL
jgi:dCMP deaminase